jgi:hypothetical protein
LYALSLDNGGITFGRRPNWHNLLRFLMPSIKAPNKKCVYIKNNYFLLSVSCFMRGGVKIAPFVIPITSLKSYKNNLLPSKKSSHTPIGMRFIFKLNINIYET